LSINQRLVFFILLVGFVITVFTVSEIVRAEEPLIECTNCHEKKLDVHIFEEGCFSCHNNDMTSLNFTRILTSENIVQNINCEECHEDKYKEVENNEHGLPGLTCETCHDPHPTGTEVEITKLNETVSIAESEPLCESCHKVSFSLWNEGLHGEIELGCTSCHDPHETSLQISAQHSISGFNIILAIIEGIGGGIFLVILSQIMYFLFKG
jgi:hypothetical protein